MDDDGRKQGGKRISGHATEFQKVNNFRVGFEFNHTIHHPHSKLVKFNKRAIIFDISDILPYKNVDRTDYTNEMLILYGSASRYDSEK